ncbi:hypothetical protein [Amycolatopsis sp. NPDC051061]|uniref:hypothetical protein n=1 Tax=Amycolatopsis sp. NPDC051061 TaxID=3155042 RepID=UPI00342D43DC
MDGPDEPESVDREAAGAPGTAQEDRGEGRLSRTLNKDYLKTFVVALVAALVTGSAAVIASSISANGAYEAAIGQQEATRKAALADEARIKRSQVYEALIDAANDYELKSNNLADEHERALLSRPQVSTDQNITNAWQDSKQKFQSTLNQVYLYGSKEAGERAANLALILPSAVGSTVRFQRVDQEKFKSAYWEFQKRMRCEVPAEPAFTCQ